jgi:hypothetical protein
MLFDENSKLLLQGVCVVCVCGGGGGGAPVLHRHTKKNKRREEKYSTRVYIRLLFSYFSVFLYSRVSSYLLCITTS